MKRMPLKDFLHMQTIFRNPKEIKPYAVQALERCNLPASAIQASSDSVAIVDMNVPAARVARHKWQPNTPNGQGTPFLFHHGKATATSASGSFMRMFKGPASSGTGDWQYSQAQAFASSGIRSSSVVAITSDGEIITGSQVDMRIIVSSESHLMEQKLWKQLLGTVPCYMSGSVSRQQFPCDRSTAQYCFAVEDSQGVYFTNKCV